MIGLEKGLVSDTRYIIFFNMYNCQINTYVFLF
jgi:hypothetical protein